MENKLSNGIRIFTDFYLRKTP